MNKTNKQIVEELRKISKYDVRISFLDNLMVPQIYLWCESQLDCMNVLSLDEEDEMKTTILEQIHHYVIKNYLRYSLEYEEILADQNHLTNKDKNISFVSLTHNDVWFNYYIEKYKNLKRLLPNVLRNICKHINDAIECYRKEIQLLGNFDTIQTVKILLGDLHYHNSVVAFHKKDGSVWYYKPRNGENELFLISFLSYLNTNGANVNIGVPRFINRKSYSFHEHIEQRPIKSSSLSSYYHNLGKVLCLFYLLHSNDIIPDNVISSKGVPFLIDCECIFSKPIENFFDDSLLCEFINSVINVGILPVWMFVDKDKRDQISSILFTFRGENRHLPRIENMSYPIDDKLLENFIEGFKELYEFLVSNKQVIAEFLKSYRYERMRIRILFHPTSFYSLLLRELCIPESLADTAYFLSLFENISSLHIEDKYVPLIVASIKEQLLDGSIPSFYVSPNSQFVIDGKGRRLKIEFNFNALEGLKNSIIKLQSLSNEDMSFQINIINESVKSFLNKIKKQCYENNVPMLNWSKQSESHVLAAAVEIGRIVTKRVYAIKESTNIIARTKSPLDGKYQVMPLNASIYDGIGGVILFLKLLGKITGYRKFDEVADKLFSELYKKTIMVMQRQEVSLSPLSGILGINYIMELFPNSYFEKDLFMKVWCFFEERLEKCKNMDYLSGVMGAVNLLNQTSLLTEQHRNRLLKSSIHTLQKSVVNSDTMSYWPFYETYDKTRALNLGGFAHGSSSASSILYKTSEILNSENTKNLALRSLAHDRSFFSKKLNGWRDGRISNFDIDTSSWCHGSTGIGLSRLLLLSYGHIDMLIREELKIVIQNIEKSMGNNCCICHGMLGNIEVWNAILNYLKMNTSQEKVNMWCEKISSDILSSRTIICGDEKDCSLMGLFMGLSGIGYQLLRMVEWHNVPSVLYLETNCNNKIFHT